MAWCLPGEMSPQAEALFASLDQPHEISVPVLWRYEVANVLLGAVRKGRVSAVKAREFMDDLEAFNIIVDDGTDYAWEEAYALAEKHRLTGYDAAYLELAIRKGLPLASLDDDLNKSAVASGVSLVAP